MSRGSAPTGPRLPEVQVVPPRQEPEPWTDLSSPPPPQLPTPRQSVDVAQTASDQQVWSRGQMKRGEARDPRKKRSSGSRVEAKSYLSPTQPTWDNSRQICDTDG